MQDRKSIYTLNKKDPEAIVYTDADKHIIRLTREDFNTETDFLKWKAWSDADYHAEENSDHVQKNHTLSMSAVAEKTGTADGPEVIIEQRFDRQASDQYTAETVIRVKGQLTEKQFRRLWMYCVDGLTEQEIADEEKVGQQSVSASITAAIKRIKKVFFSGRKL